MIIKPRQHYHVPIYQRKELVSYRLPVVCAAVLPSVPENVFTVETFYSKKGKLSLAVHSGVILGSPLELNRGQSKASLFSYSQSALNKSYPSITNSALIL